MLQKLELNEMELEQAVGGNIFGDLTDFVMDVVDELSENIFGIDTKDMAKIYDKVKNGADDKDTPPSPTHQNNSIANHGLDY